MASTADNAPLSDTEAGEKPVREQLKKATLTPKDSKTAPTSKPQKEQPRENGEREEARGRLQQKLSHEELSEEQNVDRASTESTKQHNRKRSRDSTAEEDELNNGQRKSSERSRDGNDAVCSPGENKLNGKRSTDIESPGTPPPRTTAAVEAITSPKIKRSRIHSTTLEEKDDEIAAMETSISTTSVNASNPREDRSTAAKSSISSGFSNTSTSSPFGALASTKSQSVPTDQPQTSSGAFAASGFSSLAGSTTSGFGAIGKTTGGFGIGGGFATGAKSFSSIATSNLESRSAENARGNTFGGSLGQQAGFAAATPSSGFASSTSGFGRLGSGIGGFGKALGASPFGGASGAGGLTSFASGRPSESLAGTSSRSGKAFGAPPDEDEENEDGDDEDDQTGIRSPLTQEEKQDERFYEQQLETGEEEEETAYSCRAKLYAFAVLDDNKKEWRERGLGTLRLNVKRPSQDDAQGTPKVRFLMRAEGSHRVVLNTPVKKELKFGAPGGGPPQGGAIFFMGTIDGKKGLEMLQLKVRQNLASELYSKIIELQEKM
ncbi:hypothetical protein M433DRAFT_139811 [Acidomyces richmondensis BFW]|nr:MAG: hypothetical protein FE78DRAFT_80954 [Acidomyces sp. 'richmondensis']KYG49731.1 hypothetical protein M433DRAFT_139811 [Acidomyces richmondensis BFW]